MVYQRWLSDGIFPCDGIFLHLRIFIHGIGDFWNLGIFIPWDRGFLKILGFLPNPREIWIYIPGIWDFSGMGIFFRGMGYPTKKPPLKYNRNFSRIKMANFAGDNLKSLGTGWIALEFSRRSENAFCESLFRQEIISSTLAEALSLGKVKNSSWIF